MTFENNNNGIIIFYLYFKLPRIRRLGLRKSQKDLF